MIMLGCAKMNYLVMGQNLCEFHTSNDIFDDYLNYISKFLQTHGSNHRLFHFFCGSYRSVELPLRPDNKKGSWDST